MNRSLVMEMSGPGQIGVNVFLLNSGTTKASGPDTIRRPPVAAI